MNAKPVGETGNGGGGGGEDYILIRDEKASGVSGGTFTAGSWQTRDLNTIIADTGSNASLAANQITLAPGTYKVKARAPAYAVNVHKTKLRNITDGSDINIGSSTYDVVAGENEGYSFIDGRFTITATKVLELQHRGSVLSTPFGFGVSAGFSVIEVYAIIEFWKEA